MPDRRAAELLRERAGQLRAALASAPPPPPPPARHPVTLLSPQDLLLDSLASYRLTRLVTTDRITLPLREKVTTRARETDPSPAARSLAYLVTCDYCVAVYTSALVTLVHLTPATSSAGAMLRTARYALATAGAVSAFREILDR